MDAGRLTHVPCCFCWRVTLLPALSPVVRPVTRNSSQARTEVADGVAVMPAVAATDFCATTPEAAAGAAVAAVAVPARAREAAPRTPTTAVRRERRFETITDLPLF